MHEAKTHLSQLVRDLGEGDEVVITRGGTAVARLVPAVAEPRRKFAETFGIAAGELWMADDFEDDEDEMARLFGNAE